MTERQIKKELRDYIDIDFLLFLQSETDIQIYTRYARVNCSIEHAELVGAVTEKQSCWLKKAVDDALEALHL